MSAITVYLENAFLNHVLRATGYSAPAGVYLGLFVSETDENGGGSEVTGGSYAREQITFSAPSGGEVLNSTDIEFTTATASWGTVTHAAIYDAATGGNMLFQAELVDQRLISSGDTYRIPAGDLAVALF